MTKNEIMGAILSNVSMDELDVIWGALFVYREQSIPEGIPHHDDQWGDICHIMAKITENLIGEIVDDGGEK